MGHEVQVYKAVQEGILSIDSEGRIWRIANRGGYAKIKGGSIAPRKEPKRAEQIARNGYMVVGIKWDGEKHSTGAHRLVYYHFFGEIPEDKTINHKDGNKINNHPDNLEAITPTEQMAHACKELGFDQNGEHNDMAKLTRDQVIEIRRRRKSGESCPKIARDYDVHPALISMIARGKRWASVPLEA